MSSGHQAGRDKLNGGKRVENYIRNAYFIDILTLRHILKNKIIMKEVYEKLVENLASMTPEEKEKEWEELKKYNEMGPEVKEILKIK